MKTSIQIQNLKCHGCATSIRNALTKIGGLKLEDINMDDSTIHFEMEDSRSMESVKKVLSNLGYPEMGADNPFGKKAKSYVSCAIGKVENKLA